MNNTVKRKISKALRIKALRPTLNRQEKSTELNLFNLNLFEKCLTEEFCVI